jgi:hypothetical protein
VLVVEGVGAGVLVVELLPPVEFAGDAVVDAGEGLLAGASFFSCVSFFSPVAGAFSPSDGGFSLLE